MRKALKRRCRDAVRGVAACVIMAAFSAGAAAEPAASATLPSPYEASMMYGVKSYPVPGWSPSARGAVRAGEDVIYVVNGEGTTVFSAADYIAARTERTGATPNWRAPAAARTAASGPPVAPVRPLVRGTAVPPPGAGERLAASDTVPLEPAGRPSPRQVAVRDDAEAGLGGILSEVRIGAMAHDVGVFGRSEEENAVDINAELLFISPEFLEAIWSPRPHIGITANTMGDTSQIYGGLTWGWNFWGPLFAEGTLGLSIHDGELDPVRGDKKALGCRVLFRESVSLGARFLERHSLSLMLAHISNASLCDNNEGLDTFGIRYGYRF